MNSTSFRSGVILLLASVLAVSLGCERSKSVAPPTFSETPIALMLRVEDGANRRRLSKVLVTHYRAYPHVTGVRGFEKGESASTDRTGAASLSKVKVNDEVQLDFADRPGLRLAVRRDSVIYWSQTLSNTTATFDATTGEFVVVAPAALAGTRFSP